MWIELAGFGAAVIGGSLAIYLVARLATAAYFQSKHQYEKHHEPLHRIQQPRA